MATKAAQNGSLPQRKANGVNDRWNALHRAAHRTHAGDGRLNLHRRSRNRIGVDGVIHQCCMNQRFQINRPSSRRRAKLIPGQSPARIERHSEASHRDPVQKRLKTHLRGNRVDHLRISYQAHRMTWIHHHHDPRISLDLRHRVMPGAAARRTIRMSLDHDRAPRIFAERRCQHVRKTLLARTSACDGRISCDLVDHEDIFLRQGKSGLAARIVFRYIFRDPGGA